VVVCGAVTWHTTPLLLDRSPSQEGPARTRPHKGTCRFPQSGGWGMGEWDGGKVVVGSKAIVITN
jgi:hypothetical protein